MSTVRDGEEHTLTVQLSGTAKGTWKDKAADRRGDLLDLIGHTATDGDIIQAMDAARAFLEGHEAPHEHCPPVLAGAAIFVGSAAAGESLRVEILELRLALVTVRRVGSRVWTAR